MSSQRPNAFKSAALQVGRLLRSDDRGRQQFEEDLISSFSKPPALPAPKKVATGLSLPTINPLVLFAGAGLILALAYVFGGEFWHATSKTVAMESPTDAAKGEAPVVKPRQKPMTVVYKDPNGTEAVRKLANSQNKNLGEVRLPKMTAAPATKNRHEATLPLAITPSSNDINTQVLAVAKPVARNAGAAQADVAQNAIWARLSAGKLAGNAVDAKVLPPIAQEPPKPVAKLLTQQAQLLPAVPLRQTLPPYPELPVQGRLGNERALPVNIKVPAKPVDTMPSKSAEVAPKAQTALPMQMAAFTRPDSSAQTIATLKPFKSVTPPGPAWQRQGAVFSDCADCPKLIVVQPPQKNLVAGLGFAGVPAKGFAIGMNEITFENWDRCVAEGGCKEKLSDNDWGRWNRPVINVSFDEINQQYLPWLARKTSYAYRLPTEAEWELASRGREGLDRSADQSVDNSQPSRCQSGNFSNVALEKKTVETCLDAFAGTAPVGSFEANSLGIFDLYGNVWEWTADCLRDGFSKDAAKNPVNCGFRVLKGGSWASKSDALRSDSRGWEKPEKRKNSIGFRIVRPLE